VFPPGGICAQTGYIGGNIGEQIIFSPGDIRESATTWEKHPGEKQQLTVCEAERVIKNPLDEQREKTAGLK